MIRRPPRSTHCISSAASDVYKRQVISSSLAILFGNEARGLPKEVLQQVDDISIIPIYGKAESMNLATSAAVMLMGLAMSSHARKI